MIFLMQEKKRLDYLDSLRGVAMLCVIYFHICIYLLGETTAINESLVRWRMPLFFFISGFFAFAPVYDEPLLKRRVKNRLFQQLYPTFAVWLLFILCSWLLSKAPLKEHILHGIYDPAKVGYWFTFSLVQVFMVYAVFAFMLSRVSVSRQTVIYIIIIAIFGILSLMTVNEEEMNINIKKIWNVLSLGKTIKLVAFFFGGALVRLHWEHISSIIKNYWFVAGCLAIFALTSYFTPVGEKTDTVMYLFSRVSGMMFMVSLFTCMQKYVNNITAIGRYLQRIGRNTLPVYLFHFFILLLAPYFINDISEMLRILSSNPLIELVSFTAISIVFTEITLAVDSLLKFVPFAHKAVFAK